MIPIKNKKKSLEVTVEEMRNFSLIYIEKYAPSKQQLKTYLLNSVFSSTYFLVIFFPSINLPVRAIPLPRCLLFEKSNQATA